MNNIGKRIKELRKKNDLTQEKLADYLGVTYKSVSKWETGVTFPDLSMIVPLSKLLRVTTDELLGVKTEEPDERKAFFDAEYHEYWLKEEHESDLELARQAVIEYPDEFKYLEWLAGVEWYVGYSPKYYGTEKFNELIENSIKHCQMILEDCNDTDIRNKAISCIVWDYNVLERYDEAKKYALMYPDPPKCGRDEILSHCLRGEELKALRRKITGDALAGLCDALHYMWEYSDMYMPLAMEIEEKVIRSVIDDENYLSFHWHMYYIYLERTRIAIENNDYDLAVEYLAEVKKHAVGRDKLNDAGIGKYTCMVLKDHSVDVRDGRCLGFTHLEYFRESLAEDKIYAPLRDRDDFRKLLK
ncbi:MAG: helix-turn-helix transcriptional regulator [Clostridia bacterium]|nr:helix-turn-helix transcriptional regulator [Clostridia bacterium]